MSTNTSNNTGDTFGNIYRPIPPKIRFWLLLLLDIPAVLCSFFLLYHLLLKRDLRQALHNHVVILLLFVILSVLLIDVPSYIVVLSTGYVWLAFPWFCNIWSFVSFGLFDMIAILMALGSMERHILVFHSSWMNSTRNRFLFHYLPLTLVTFYGIVFYIWVIFFPSCSNIYDYSQPYCGYPCYFDQQIVGNYDFIVNVYIPMLTIVIFNVGLIVRQIRQKKRIDQIIQWRKHRKMIVQMLSVCCLYLIFYLPCLISAIPIHLGFLNNFLINLFPVLAFNAYFIPLLMPYVVLASLPSIWQKWAIIKWMKTQNRVAPVMATATVERRPQ
ncbi:unnamed protein product [Adineta ricciae]|uniref:G-protein coupled receptors family 1 profile domain-containing protein n=1 Tax=Adineta ricciae TaxID=249248 RepID=A0A814UCY2_ADIRI|nr:unnamed protein product [Adineta ricciae]CAF1276247.1 unnamed protein product [Adineta ricciae]